jgi:hypothetical protein
VIFLKMKYFVDFYCYSVIGKKLHTILRLEVYNVLIINALLIEIGIAGRSVFAPWLIEFLT